MTRAIVYARVSTDEQAERGYSLESQVKACRDYAAAHGFELVGEFQDDYTGSKLDRPALSQARAILEAGGADVLIVLSNDRLTRSLAHSLLLREQFRRLGVDLHYARRGKTEDTPEGRMLENVEGIFNEYWREKIVEATRRGLRAKAELGIVVGQGGPPYGYRFDDDGRLAVYEPEAAIVRRIFALCVHDKLTARPIAKALTADGTPTPAEGANRRRRRHAPGTWNKTTITRILRDETYAGTWRYGKRSKDPATSAALVAVAVPPIVDRATWQAAAAQLAANRDASPRNVRREYMLRGRVFCSHCGRRMVGTFCHTKDGGAGYYTCTFNREVIRGQEARCPQRGIRVVAADDQVWKYVLELLTAGNFEARLREALQAQALADADAAQAAHELRAAAAVAADLAACEAEADALAAEIGQSGPAMRKALGKRKSRIEDRHAALVAEQARIDSVDQARRAADTVREDAIGALDTFRREVAAGLAQATFEDKRRMLDWLGVKVTAADYNVTVGVCPQPDQSFTARTPSFASRKPLLERVFDLSPAHKFRTPQRRRPRTAQDAQGGPRSHAPAIPTPETKSKGRGAPPVKPASRR